MSAREKLIEKIYQQGDPGSPDIPNPVVSLDDFFQGNDDVGSIGCNLDSHPGIDTFYQVLRSVRARESVQDVLVRINAVEDMWPFSDVVYVISSSPLEQIREWLKPLQPDEVEDGLYWDQKLATDVELLPGMRIMYAWWD